MSIFLDSYIVCENCNYMASKEKQGHGADVLGINDVRVHNYERILNILKEKYSMHKTILDIGCADGLFLDLASNYGYEVTGLEPDHRKYTEAIEKGFNVIEGFFPDALDCFDSVYDVIIFNDSFEHIPYSPSLIAAIKKHLKPEKGILIVSLPSSDGIIFKISSFWARKIGRAHV